MDYRFSNTSQVITPALVYYKDQLQRNLETLIRMSNGPEWLWPHVKSHKISEVVKMQMEQGIYRFKCATVAEAEMVAKCGATDILLAYPLVGPNIERYIDLCHAYREVRFFTLGDDLVHLKLLADASNARGLVSRVLVDVDMGMNRTGIAISELETFYVDANKIEGISIVGLHGYDGHQNQKEYMKRCQEVQKVFTGITEVIHRLRSKSLFCEVIVMGGSPTFPCYCEYDKIFYSPGTLFINDHGYATKYPDLKFEPAAAVLTRVISTPGRGRFTLDLGYKGIAADPAGMRGRIVGFDHVRELFQSEEHWVFEMEEGYLDHCPVVGDEFFVIPTHVCPTTMLYPSVLVIENQEMMDEWEVIARNRKITY